MALNVLHSRSPQLSVEIPIPQDGAPWQDIDRARLRETFLHWWHASQECLVAALNLYRRFDDDDISALYIATWLSALEEIQDGALAAGEGSIVGLMARLEPTHFSGIGMARLCDITGIPRETARRKLDKAVDLMLIECIGKARFRLRALSTDIMPLFENCIALADTTLGCLDKPRTRQVSDLTAESWVALMHEFFSVMLAFWSVRRSVTRGASVVSVQVAIELLTTLKIYRKVATTGASPRISLQDALAIAPHCHKTRYYLVQIAEISHLPMVRVRRMCRNLAAHGRLEFIGTDVVRPRTSEKIFTGQLPDGVFSLGLRDAGLRFIKTASATLRTVSTPRQ